MMELDQDLVTALAGRYEIERELGHGGMAIVYLARDVKHQRHVALKVLRPELAASVGPERFLREIAIAAPLVHPNILTLHDSGDAAGHLYYVMPYVNGPTLGQRLKREVQLPIDDALAITRQIAAALDFAHARGVIHRDIKPDNILLHDDHVFVADFGLARALSSAASSPLTDKRFVVGTALYMSPEQCTPGRGVDARSDIYSLGCVVFEMITGVPPFRGATADATMSHHLTSDPPSLRTERRSSSSALDDVVRRALAKAPADRFRTAGEFARALGEAGGTRPEVVGTPTEVVGTRTRVVGSKGVVAIVAVVAVLAAGAAAVASSRLNGSRKPAAAVGNVPRIAVLRFQNDSQPTEKLFAEGLADELTTRIAAMKDLVVISRARAMQYDPDKIEQLGRDLGVDYVLTGRIQTDRASNQTRVWPELIRLPGGEVIWKPNPLPAALAPQALFAVQSAIADSVARSLDVSLPDRAARSVPTTNNFQAYEQFLRGNALAVRIYDRDALRLAIEAYESATKLDPGFTLAFAKLAQVRSVYFAFSGRRPEEEVLAKRALDTALARDSALPATRVARGFYHNWVRRNRDSAVIYLSEAQHAEPNNAELLAALGLALQSQAQWDSALAASRRATQLDPLSGRYRFDVATTEFWMGRYADADQDFRAAIALAPDYLPPYITRSYMQMVWRGDSSAVIRVLDDALLQPSLTRTRILRDLIPRFRPHLAMLDAPWQTALERLTAAEAGVDAGPYFLAKAELFRRKNDAGRARAYFDSARSVFDSLTRRNPNEPEFHSELGFAYAGLKHIDAAEREGRTALALSRRDVTTRAFRSLNLARGYVISGQHDAAIDELRAQLETTSLISRPLLRHHPDFAPLRQLPRFQELVRENR
jgi:serine/threonine-protein kinase